LLPATAEFAGLPVAARQKLFKGQSRTTLQRFTPLSKLHDVQTALAALYFGYERLSIADTLGERGLGEAGLVAQLHQQIQEGAVVAVVG
jgi:hypothetical protein